MRKRKCDPRVALALKEYTEKLSTREELGLLACATRGVLEALVKWCEANPQDDQEKLVTEMEFQHRMLGLHIIMKSIDIKPPSIDPKELAPFIDKMEQGLIQQSGIKRR